MRRRSATRGSVSVGLIVGLAIALGLSAAIATLHESRFAPQAECVASRLVGAVGAARSPDGRCSDGVPPSGRGLSSGTALATGAPRWSVAAGDPGPSFRNAGAFVPPAADPPPCFDETCRWYPGKENLLKLWTLGRSPELEEELASRHDEAVRELGRRLRAWLWTLPPCQARELYARNAVEPPRGAAPPLLQRWQTLSTRELRQFRLRDPLTLPPAALVGSEGGVCGATAPTEVEGALAEEAELRLLKSALAEGIRKLSEGDAREMYLRWLKRENPALTGDDLQRLEGLSTRALVYPDEPAAKLRPSVGDYLRCNLGTMQQSESCYDQGLGFFREYMDRKHPRKDEVPSPR